MDKITNLKEVIKNSLRELMEKEQKNKVTTTISKKKKIKEAAFNMLNESCTCMTANTGPGANSQPFIPVYNTCASSQGNAVAPMATTWCCTMHISPMDICDDSCLDSNNPCFGNIDPVLPTGGKPFGKLPADISSLTKDTRTRGVKPTTDRDFMSKDRMLKEIQSCNPPFMSGGVGNNCGVIGSNYDCQNGTGGTLINSVAGCLCATSSGAIIQAGTDDGCPQNVAGGGPRGVIPTDVRTGTRTKGVAVRPTGPTIDPMDMMMREAAKNIIKKND